MRLRPSALSTAATLFTTAALLLGISALPATAQERTTATIGTFTLASNVITQRTSTEFFGTVTVVNVSTSAIASATTDVTINGRRAGVVPLILGRGTGGVDIPRGWGAGRVRLGPTTFTYEDGTTSTDETLSSAFDARRDVRTTRKDNVALTVSRSGDTHRYRVKGLKVIRPSSGTYVSLRTVKLQYAENFVWKTRATITLDAKGNGSYKRKFAGTYRWRLYSPETKSKVEFRSLRTNRI